ncbi:bifunctional tRNA (5-methylaminomethyl-2-thiouridine)(34)-methyltransferase MnmD/FAD-dependent 5-carboxymethylaminomethyl-2-thiouridine(34) oxidoreductase MnmC [Neptuniibacter sp. PT8_73]|uniref:bifunctional tRNA (5-methylaminomethyl-2-thiouridine)(34)-methyltransferase MnmD/FAD-dependent 5-carboxymethylaminomethyl-2-thiouridine(34) oxidoreductase MnmC n=1 Tax=Neptuniibacter sp. PT8_73 TaxID=3398206 RepID=UPI0039F56C3B
MLFAYLASLNQIPNMSNSKIVNWKHNSPISTIYDDIYFSIDDGIKETQYVFEEGNNLDIRLTCLDHERPFTTAETGFGTGLNFISLWKRIREMRSNRELHFISTEKYPLNRSDLKKALSNWPELTDLADQLVSQYPLNTSGFHHLYFDNNRIKLTLMFGDAGESYSRLSAKVDAWYLDGFAPSKNPDMWSPELFREIARLSKPDTTFSTFTAAGIVKRGLRDVGFDVRKQKGFGRKREMLVGTFVESTTTTPIDKPWFELPASKKPEEVTIIGGGLSGCSTARALAERGVKVTLIEQENQLATGGSGNPQGALYAKLPVKQTTQGELHLSGFLYSVNMLKRIDPVESFWSQCGVMQLATSDKELARQNNLIEQETYPQELVSLKNATELSKIAGTAVNFGGLFFPSAGWVSPRALCKHFVDHPNISVVQQQVKEISYAEDHWQLTTQSGEALSANHVVICNAEMANQFNQTDHLPLKTIRGQVSITEPKPTNSQLNSVVCGDGYISPAQNQQYCFGATYDLQGKERNVTQEDHESNLEKLGKVLPDIHADLASESNDLQGRTAFRCSTPDYMPIVGPAPVQDEFIETFAQLRKDRKWRFENAEAEHHPNLYVNTGHGSKGLITCPISAELLASMICDEPLPLPKDVIDAINPARFIIKKLIKQTI